jgi:hypothetical protein
MAYIVRCTDVKRDGATYECRDRHRVLELVKTLLEHGTVYVGDKIMRIEITRGKLVKPSHHNLVIKSFHDAMAECSCGKWYYCFPGLRTRAQIETEFAIHLKGDAKK